MSKKVNKALTEEELAGLSDIGAIVQGLIASSNGADVEMMEDEDDKVAMEEILDEEGIEKADDAPEDEEDLDIEKAEEEEDEVDKAIVETPSEGATANDPAEEAIEENLTEISEESVQEVAKAIIQSLTSSSKKKVKKSKDEMIIDAIKKVAVSVEKSNKVNANRLGALENAVGEILNGYGLIDSIEKSQPKRKTQPIQTSENSEVLKWINEVKSQVGNNNNRDDADFTSQSSSIRKNLNRDTMMKLFGQKK